jgi:8-oxo-dGTP diphosphatase
MSVNRTEPVELANLCMIYDGDRILLQNRVKKDWQGYTFPGGHVEPNESFIDSVIREVKEETGLTIKNPKLCGVKQFKGENGRYIVFLYKTNEFEGTLQSSDEGNVLWIDRNKIRDYKTVNHFQELLDVFDKENLSEFLYDDEWNPILK